MMCKRMTNLLVIVLAVAGGFGGQFVHAAPRAKSSQIQIVADAMDNESVARRIVGQLRAVTGVESVAFDLNTQTVSILFAENQAASLSLLWDAVEQGKGRPMRLKTAEATYTLSPPALHSERTARGNWEVHVVIDNLHCKGCAKKIAAQLYVIPGVTQVRVDMPTETLLIKLQSNGRLSPWRFVDAVRKAKERPLAITGPCGNLKIEWASERPTNSQQHAQNQAKGGILR